MASTKSPERNGKEGRTVIGRTTTVVTDVREQVQSTAAEATEVVAKHAPAVLAGSRGALDRALAALRGSPSGSIALGTVFAAGVTGGMVLSRAPHVLTALAFLPTMLLGGTLVGRAIIGPDGPSRGART